MFEHLSLETGACRVLPWHHRGPVTIVFLKLIVLGSERKLALEVYGWSWIPSGTNDKECWGGLWGGGKVGVCE